MEFGCDGTGEVVLFSFSIIIEKQKRAKEIPDVMRAVEAESRFLR